MTEPQRTSRPDPPSVDAPRVDAAEQDPDVDELSREGHDEAAARRERADGGPPAS